jgi:hypothetical protein
VVRNVLQVATEEGEGVSGLVLEEKKALEGLGQMSPRQLEKEQEDSLRRMQEAISGKGISEGVFASIAMVPAIGPGIAAAAAITMGGVGRVEGAGLSDDELTDVMTKYGPDVEEYVTAVSEGRADKIDTEKNKFAAAATMKNADPAAKKLMEYFQKAPTSAATAFLGEVGKGKGGAREFVGVRMYQAEQESLERVRKVAKSQADVSESLSADTRESLKDIQTTLGGVQDIEGYQAAMGDVETLAGKLKGPDIQRLARGEGGTFGRMAAAMARTDEIQAMGGKKFEDVRRGISSALGVKDITQLMDKEQAAELKKFVSDDQITEEEAGKLQESFKKSITTAVGETARDREDINKQMVSSMQAYTKANTTFVQVAGDALAKMGGVDPEIVQSALGQMGTTNWVEQGKST